MTISTVTVNIPFPLSSIDQVNINVTCQTTVLDIIKESLIQQKPDSNYNISEYALFIKPQNAILLPCLRLSDYKRSLFGYPQNSQTNNNQQNQQFFSRGLSLDLIPKKPFQVVINFLNHQIQTLCDLSQTIDAVIRQCIHGIQNIYVSDLSEKEVKINGEVLSSNIQLSKILAKYNHIPTIYVKREVPRPKVPTMPIFKGNINDALTRDDYIYPIPHFLSIIFEILVKYKEIVGIYRLSGEFTQIEQIAEKIDSTRNNDELLSYLAKQRVHDLSCTVKLYLRQLYEPLIPSFMALEFKNVLNFGGEDEVLKLQKLKNLVQNLPEPNFKLFSALCEHLDIISSQSAVNQMTKKNLAICIGTNILRVSQGAAAITETTQCQTIITLILEHWRYLFLNEPLDPEHPTYRVIRPQRQNNTFEGSDENDDSRKEVEDNELMLRGGLQLNSIVTLDRILNENEWIVENNGQTVTINPNILEACEDGNNFQPEKIVLNPLTAPINAIQNLRYLEPDEPNECTTPEAKGLIKQRIDRATCIENELDVVLEKLAQNPNDRDAVAKYNELSKLFNQL